MKLVESYTKGKEANQRKREIETTKKEVDDKNRNNSGGKSEVFYWLNYNKGRMELQMPNHSLTPLPKHGPRFWQYIVIFCLIRQPWRLIPLKGHNICGVLTTMIMGMIELCNDLKKAIKDCLKNCIIQEYVAWRYQRGWNPHFSNQGGRRDGEYQIYHRDGYPQGGPGYGRGSGGYQQSNQLQQDPS